MSILSPKDRVVLGIVLAVNLICLPIGFGRDYFEFQAVQRAAAEHSRALARDAHRYLQREQVLGGYGARFLTDADAKVRH
jgi:hypothetical protein